MKRIILFLFAVTVFFACSNSVDTNRTSKKTTQKVISKLVTNQSGKTYLEVDGKPMLYNGVQAWLPEDGNYELYMRKAHEVGYQIFTFWFPWRSIEPAQGQFDWTALDKIIEQAEKYDMRLDIVWGGSNFCGGLDPRFVPDFILKDTSLFVKNDIGLPIEVKKFDMGMCNIADYSDENLLDIESNTVRTMMDYLYHRDSTHRVVFFQVENEPNLFNWTHQDKKDILAYCNAIGKVVKTAPNSIATRMNLAHDFYEPMIDDLEFIDCHGVDIYSDDLDVLHSAVNFETKMPHVAENAAYENSSTLMAEAFAGGGFYNIYRLDYDYVWKNPGVYGDDWIFLHQTFDVKMLNTGLNKIARQVTVSPSENMLCFNTSTKKPVSGLVESKILKGFEIGFKSLSEWTEEGVGFVLFFEGSYYLIADNQCFFFFNEKVKADEGFFNENDQWVSKRKVDLTMNPEGKHELKYHYYECIRISI